MANRSPGVIPFGQRPDGYYVGSKAAGFVIETVDLLLAGGSFESDWIDTGGWSNIEILISSDQESALQGVIVEFTNDIQDGIVRSSFNFTFGSEQVSSGVFIRKIPTNLDGFRIRYINGSVGQNSFFLGVVLKVLSTEPRTTLNALEIGSAEALLTKSSLVSVNDLNNYETIKISDSGGLRVSLVEHETEIPIKALSNWKTNQLSVSSIAPVRVAISPLNERKTIVFKNNGTNETDVFIGPDSTVTVSDGFPVGQFESIELELDDGAELWAITPVGGSSGEQFLDPDSVETNNGVTNPTNAFTSNNLRAEFSNVGDFVIYNIENFNFSGTFDTISDVEIGIEIRRQADVLQTVAHQETVSFSDSGGTSIISPQISSGNNQCYVVFISNGNTSVRNVLSVTGGGLVWSEVSNAINSSVTGGISCWVSTGSPTANFTVTASFNGTVNQKAISVHRYSGVSQTSPIQASDLEEAPGTGSNTITNTPISGTAVNGVFVVGINCIDRDPDITTPNNLRSDLSVGGVLNHEVLDGTAGSSNQVVGTTTDNRDWILTALTLQPANSENPIFKLSYEVGIEGDGDTILTQEVSQTVDTTFELDITADRSWSQSDINNLKVKIEATHVVNSSLEMDHVFVKVTESVIGNVQRCAFLEIG